MGFSWETDLHVYLCKYDSEKKLIAFFYLKTLLYVRLNIFNEFCKVKNQCRLFKVIFFLGSKKYGVFAQQH